MCSYIKKKCAVSVFSRLVRLLEDILTYCGVNEESAGRLMATAGQLAAAIIATTPWMAPAPTEPVGLQAAAPCSGFGKYVVQLVSLEISDH